MAEALADPVLQALEWIRGAPVVHPDETAWLSTLFFPTVDVLGAVAERFGSEWYGQRLVAGAKRLMAAWHDWHDGQIDRRSRDERLRDERQRIHRLLVSARERAPAHQTRRQCAASMRTEERMWTFLEVEGMPVTNNLAERCLRRAIIWRKKSFGIDSEGGSRFVERILSVVTTLQMQNRDVFGYLCAARMAAVQGQPAPSLVPHL